MVLVGLSNSEILPTEINEKIVPKKLRKTFPNIKFYRSHITGKVLVGRRVPLNEIERITQRVSCIGETAYSKPENSTIAIREIFKNMQLTLSILQMIESGTLCATGEGSPSTNKLVEEALDSCTKELESNTSGQV